MNRSILWSQLKDLYKNANTQAENRIYYYNSSAAVMRKEIDRIENIISSRLTEQRKIKARAMYDASVKEYEAFKDPIKPLFTADEVSAWVKEWKIGEDCAICHEVMDNMQCRLHCGHVFHNTCIENVFFVYLSNKCPMCRAEFRFNTDCSFGKKRRRKLKKRMIKKMTKDDGTMSMLELTNAFTFISANTLIHWSPQWLFKVLMVAHRHSEDEHDGYMDFDTVHIRASNDFKTIRLYEGHICDDCCITYISY